jgi:hypothetical protein
MYEITCPSCQKALRIPQGFKESTLTCPRCLAKIDNPNLAIRAELPTPTASPPEAVTGAATCPSCGRTVEKLWGYCPSCRAPLDQPLRNRRKASVDKETHGDTAAIGGGLVLLSLLGAVGIIFFFCGGPAQHVLPGDTPTRPIAIIGMIISTVLFGLVVVGMVLAGKSRVPGLGTGTIVTGAITIPLLVLTGAISWFIYVCGGCAGPDLFKPTGIGSDEKGRKK